MGWDWGGWNWGRAPGRSRGRLRARELLGAFGSAGNGIRSGDIPEISRFLSQLLTCRLALEVWGFSWDCWDGPGTLAASFPGMQSWFFMFPLDAGPFLSLCPTAGIPGPSGQDLGWGILVLWSLPELPPSRQGKAGGAGKLEMASERGRTDGFGLGCFFSQLSEELLAGSLAFCCDSKGRELLDHPGPHNQGPNSHWNVGHWFWGPEVPALGSWDFSVPGMSWLPRVPVLGRDGGCGPSHPATFQQISGSFLPKPIRAVASSAAFPVPRCLLGYFCGLEELCTCLELCQPRRGSEGRH